MVFIKMSEQGYYICYVELKSDSPSGYESQFISTKCFMDYVISLSERLCGQPITIFANVTLCFILILKMLNDVV